jgi:hypothetical protein
MREPIPAHPQHPLRTLELGRVVVTASCLSRLTIDDEPALTVQVRDLAPLLRRHASGDYGDALDPWLNDAALEDGGRLLSVYEVRGQPVWVITDGESDACPACWTGVGRCEPELGEWHNGIHFRTDLPARRLSTTVLLPEDY